jgi:predicted SnoaL-like aldol condensation-catalyzing enzyme
MIKTTPVQNKALVLEAFDTLFNKRDYNAAERYWSSNYIQATPIFGAWNRRVAGWIQKHHAASAHAESLNPSPT